MQPRILSIDGSYLARSRFEAGAMPGDILRAVVNLREEYKPKITMVAWDAPGGSVRKEVSEAYKSNRHAAPEAYLDLLKEVRYLLNDFGVTQLEAKGYEGDDILFTITKTMPGPHLIWTADKDLLQAVAKDVSMLWYKRGNASPLVTPENIVELTGLNAREYGDMLTLAGDPVDGIPGLSRVGKERAKGIILACSDFVSLILGDQEDVARRRVMAQDARQVKYVEQAIAEKEQLRISRELTRLRLVPDMITVTEETTNV